MISYFLSCNNSLLSEGVNECWSPKSRHSFARTINSIVSPTDSKYVSSILYVAPHLCPHNFGLEVQPSLRSAPLYLGVRNILHKSFIFNSKGKCAFENSFTAKANTWLWQPIIGFLTFLAMLGLTLVLSAIISKISSHWRLIDSNALFIVTICLYWLFSK